MLLWQCVLRHPSNDLNAEILIGMRLLGQQPGRGSTRLPLVEDPGIQPPIAMPDEVDLNFLVVWINIWGILMTLV